MRLHSTLGEMSMVSSLPVKHIASTGKLQNRATGHRILEDAQNGLKVFDDDYSELMFFNQLCVFFKI
jgi:hypothetical protein